MEARDADRVSWWAVANEQQPRFSPDGRWLAYESTESGRVERLRPAVSEDPGQVTISTGGGTNAVWSSARRSCSTGAADGRIMVVPHTAAGEAFQR